MENKRKQQILTQANQAYKSWTSSLSSQTFTSEIDNTIEKICQSLAFGTIVSSGHNSPASYIGTYKQCFNLKQRFGGQIGALKNNWYWIGLASVEQIRYTVHNYRKNFQVSVLEQDLINTVLLLGEVASLDIKYGIKEQNLSVYIGGYMICILLKRHYGGKIGKKHNHWFWKGYASFYHIDYVYKNYQQSARRYNRKKIILKL